MDNVIRILFGFAGLGLGAAIGIYFGKNKAVVPDGLVSKEAYDLISKNLDIANAKIAEQDMSIRTLTGDLATKDESLKQVNEKLKNQVKEVDDIRKQMTESFKNIANEILESRSGQFVQNSKDSLTTVLKPFQEKLDAFNKEVRNFRDNDIAEKSVLKTTIQHLSELNKNVSDNANNLTKALKGDSKLQGDWGEFQLESILKSAGLEEGIQYRMRKAHIGEDGNTQMPDCVVNLPNDRNLIIDSKVSLTAFVDYFNAETDEKRAECAKKHVESVEKHIKELSEKRYDKIDGLKAPDYVVMFIPNEPALILAIREDATIVGKALERNIVLATGISLLALMKTVNFMWKQDKQARNVLLIAKVGGSLYDKFVGFLEDLKDIGSCIGKAQLSYDSAMNKLKTGTGSIISRVEKLKELGAKAGKGISQNLIDDANESNLLGEQK